MANNIHCWEGALCGVSWSPSSHYHIHDMSEVATLKFIALTGILSPTQPWGFVGGLQMLPGLSKHVQGAMGHANENSLET